jgi:hypothetical protein
MIAPYTVPFTILIDTAESQPFTFDGLRADADKDARPLVVRTRFQSLGRYPDSLGDYSIDGLVGRVHVERKSLEDCQGTVLGWESSYEREHFHPGRRLRFESELMNLAECEAAIVVVEATIEDCMRQMRQWGVKSAAVNAKIFHRSVLAYIQDYQNVPWLFCESRRMAEIATFRFLERFWYHHRKEIQEVNSAGHS